MCKSTRCTFRTYKKSEILNIQDVCLENIPNRGLFLKLHLVTIKG